LETGTYLKITQKLGLIGVEVHPFLLPRFLTPRIFTLEFIQQSLSFDYIHFVSRKYKESFKLKKEVDFYFQHQNNFARGRKSISGHGISAR